MILCYHNITDDKVNNITDIKFSTFMHQLNFIKKHKPAKLEEYVIHDPDSIVLTFDDGKKSLLKIAPILKKNNIPFYFFVVGDLIGEEEFLDLNDINRLIKEYGGQLGWHSKTHHDLSKLEDEQSIVDETISPFKTNIFAYPDFKFSKNVINVLKKEGYKYALSGNHITDGHFGNLCLDRLFVTEETSLEENLYFNDRIVKYIDFALFSFPCNLKCKYCYVAQHSTPQEREKIYPSKYSPSDLKKALKFERMGGECIATFATPGESLLLDSSLEYIKAILDAGHFVHISTNLTPTKNIKKLLALSEEYKSRLFFKASFQYQQLIEKNLLKRFVDNCNLIWSNDCTCAIELVPDDSIIKDIDEIKKISLKYFGALPHLTLPRDEALPGIQLLSKYKLNKLKEIWESFYSEEFRFKCEKWGRKIESFCYSGKFSCFVDINRGTMLTCPQSKVIGNFFEGEKLYEEAAAYCPQEHCFVCHNWLGFGCCPDVDGTNYLLERDRVTQNGKHWVAPRCRHAFRQRVCDNNELFDFNTENILYNRALISSKSI